MHRTSTTLYYSGLVPISLTSSSNHLEENDMATTTTTDPILDAEEKALCRAINQFRAANGRPALKVSVALVRAAEWMSNDMARNDNFDHTDSRGRDFASRLAAFGYNKPVKGENIAGGEAAAAATVAQWKNSPPHRANMLNTKFKVMGVGRAHSGDSMLGWYWTADFGGTVTRTMPI
jgi:uncharacterized protein YkwD